MNIMHGNHYERKVVDGVSQAVLVPNRMNPIRRRLLDRIGELMVDYHKNPIENHQSLVGAQALNREFMERSRGHGRG